MNDRLPDIMERILDCNSDVVFLTETWLQTDENAITAEVKTYGYELLHNRRKDREKERGGGVGLLVRNNISAKQLKVKHYSSLEYTVVQIKLCNRKSIFLISFYRLQEVAVSTFVEDFTDLLNDYTIPNEHFIIAGDINIHMETDDANSNKIKDLIDIYDLKQHVEVPTHVKGHTLDVVITPKKNTLGNLRVASYDLSHHSLIDFDAAFEFESAKGKRRITHRSKNVDIAGFRKDANDTLLALPKTDDLNEKIKRYNTALANVVNKHAPILSKTITVVPDAPWFDAEYRNLRKLRRKAEKKFRKSQLDTDKKVYQSLRKQAVNLAFDKKKQFVSSKLEQGCSKTLYAVVNELIDNKKQAVLPKAESDASLANKFQIFFREKIEKIRSSFTPSPSYTAKTKPNPNLQKLSVFEPTNVDEISNIVKSFGIKCSPDDPVPTNLLSESETLIPFWVEIVISRDCKSLSRDR